MDTPEGGPPPSPAGAGLRGASWGKEPLSRDPKTKKVTSKDV